MSVNNSINTSYVISGNGGFPTNNAILLGSGTKTVSATTLTDGQLLIGNTGNAPSAATLTAGSNITITNSSGGITIAASAGGTTYNTVASSTQALTSGQGYICNNGSTQIVFTLPSTASSTIGQYITIIGYSSGGWKIAQNASQQIIFGSSATTVGTGGYIVNGNQYDNITMCFIGTLGGNGIWSVIDCVSSGVSIT